MLRMNLDWAKMYACGGTVCGMLCCAGAGGNNNEPGGNRLTTAATVSQQHREHVELQQAWSKFLKLFLQTAAEVRDQE